MNTCPTCRQHIRTGRGGGDDLTARDIDLIYHDAITHWAARAARRTTPAPDTTPPPTTTTVKVATIRPGLALHCDTCPATFPLDQAVHLARHTTTEHDRRPTTGERTPKATT